MYITILFPCLYDEYNLFNKYYYIKFSQPDSKYDKVLVSTKLSEFVECKQG